METIQLKGKKFQRNKEDFVCESCDTVVLGDGYRNHCPSCLVSKHVDVHPGDRAELCGGLMDPVDIDLKHGKLSLVHQCRSCGTEKKNRTHVEDSVDAITRVMKEVAKKK